MSASACRMVSQLPWGELREVLMSCSDWFRNTCCKSRLVTRSYASLFPSKHHPLIQRTEKLRKTLQKVKKILVSRPVSASRAGFEEDAGQGR